MFWGKRKENGIWFSGKSRLRILFGGDRIIYLALNKFRVRLMNPLRG